MLGQFLVVGGAGFIGSRLTLRLLSLGHQVRVLDNLSTGLRGNLSSADSPPELIVADMRDSASVTAAMDGVDAVVLLAAIPSVARSVADPVGTTDVNIGGMVTVLEAARRRDVERLVFASSAAVYGKSPDPMPRRESQTPLPASPYAVAKLTGEHHARVFRELFSLRTVSLRFFNVFGPHQRVESEYASAVPRFMSALMSGRRPVVFGTGMQTRDFVYVENVVDAVVLAATGDDPGPGPFNIGAGRSTSVLAMLEMIGGVLGVTVEPQFTDSRPGDVMASEADIALARSALGYEPRVPIEQGLAEMAAWLGNSRTKS